MAWSPHKNATKHKPNSAHPKCSPMPHAHNTIWHAQAHDPKIKKPPPHSYDKPKADAQKSKPTWPKPKSNPPSQAKSRSEEHTSELQSRGHLVCRLLLEQTNQVQHQLG